MKFLLLSGFAENGRESGANRLCKLRFGLEAHGHSCTWIGPAEGFISTGAVKKAVASWQMLSGALRWARLHPEGFVLVSLPPPWLLPIAFVISLFLSRRLVLDFRDPILNQRINSRGALYRFASGRLEAGAIRRARLVIVAASRIKEHIHPAARTPVTVLAGLDERELAETRNSGAQRDRTKIVYGGTFYGSRSPLSLLQAIAADSGKLNFEFYVSFNSAVEEAEVRAQIAALRLESRVKLFPLQAREKFLGILRGAGAGLIITHSEGSDYAIPGKVFDYLTAGLLPWVITRDPGLTEFLAENKVRSLVTSGWEKENFMNGLRELERNLAENTGEASPLERLSVKHQAALLLEALQESPDSGVGK